MRTEMTRLLFLLSLLLASACSCPSGTYADTALSCKEWGKAHY